MCGIIGYVGTGNTADILLDSLELLEYRGYDSAGVAFHNGKNIRIFKCPGRVSQLREMIEAQDAACGIGHTRWATHGAVNFKNAHPHTSGRVTLVHNGIIENYKELIEEYHLEDQLVSECDTEVAAALLDRFYNGDPYQAIEKLAKIVVGTYAFVILFEDRKDEIYAVRKVSPIVMSKTENECVLASDLMPLSRFSNQYYVLPEHAVLKMSPKDFEVKDFDGNMVEPSLETMDWEVEQLNRKGYSTYMEKEISEQTDVIYRTFAPRIKDGLPNFEVDGLDDSFFDGVKEIHLVACGTSYHASLIGKYLMEKYAGMKAISHLASEFIYSDEIMDEHSVLIGISQSGETIDTLEAIKIAKKKGIPCIGIVNVKGSAISLEADCNLFTNAGPEIAVASTKAYTCQLAILYLLAFRLGLVRGKISEEETKHLIEELEKVPGASGEILKNRENYDALSKEIIHCPSLFMIGRGLDYYVLLEGSLKLKEISYIHSDAYASGELKHGPIALIEEGVPVIASVTQEKLILKQVSNIKEVLARHATMYVLVKEAYADQLPEGVSKCVLPNLDDDFMVFPCVIALQCIAYYTACNRGLNVDKPRNLAKVVTVE